MIKLPGVLTSNSNNRIYVGFNLGERFCQISYCTNDGRVDTISAIAGGEEYNIPTVLCKREGVNQWFYGREAVKYAAENDGVLIDNLLGKALDGEPVLIEGVNYQPISLLSLFIKRCMSLVQAASNDKLQGVLFTADYMDYDHMEILREAVGALKLKAEKIYFQSHMESFYHYMIHQPNELWQAGCILFEYETDEIKVYRMVSNLHTDPVVVYIEDSAFPMPDGSRTNEPDMEYELLQMDKTFTNIARDACETEKTYSVFLIGSSFSDNWMKESKKYLCGKYRVFQGSNLYSKGACFGLIDRMLDLQVGKDNIFLGNDKLTANIGMNILRQGDLKYFALLDAGVNWFDADAAFDFYIQDTNVIEVRVCSLIGGGDFTASISLDEFSGKLSRMHAHLYLENVKSLVVEIEDLGLGEFRASSNKVWRESIALY